MGEGCRAGGEHCEGDPAADRGPFAHLVLVESEAALGVLECGLDGPAEPGDADQPGETGALGVLGQVGQVVGVLVLAPVPADQQALLTLGPSRVEREVAPGVDPLAARASPGGSVRPVPGRDLLGEVLDPHRLDRGVGPGLAVLADFEHVGDALGLGAAPHRFASAVDGVAGQGGGDLARGDAAGQDLFGLNEFRGEADLLGDPDGGHPLRIGRPGFGQVELVVDQVAAVGGGPGGEDGHGHVLDAARGAGVLPLDADGVLAFLQVAGLVENEPVRAARRSAPRPRRPRYRGRRPRPRPRR